MSQTSEVPRDGAGRTDANMIAEFTVGIASDLVSALLQYGGRKLLHGTRMGARLKARFGWLDEKTQDEFKKLLLESYFEYFVKFPDRQYQVLYDFFASDEVSKALFDYVLNFVPIDCDVLEQGLRQHMGEDWLLFRILRRQGLTLETVVTDFVECYQERELRAAGVSVMYVVRELRATEARLADSLVQGMTLKLQHLERDLARLGISSEQLPLLQALGRDASRVEAAVYDIRGKLLSVLAPAEHLSLEAERLQGTPPQFTEDARDILRHAMRLHYLVENLYWSKEHRLQFASAAIGPILEEMADIYKPLAWRKQLEIKVRPLQRSFPHLEICESSFRLAVNNLLDNAIKFSDRGTPQKKGQVTLTGRRYSSRDFRLSVSSHGVAILPEEYERVFEDGYQAKEARDPYRVAVGRGLYVAKCMVEGHHGRIYIRSERAEENYETTVDLYLPYHQPR